MESFLLFLYTAILSLLIAFLLGKLFTDDAPPDGAAGHDAAPSTSVAAVPDGGLDSREFVDVDKIGGGDEVGVAGSECESCSAAQDVLLHVEEEKVVKDEAVLEHVLLHEEKVAKHEAVQGAVVEHVFFHDEGKVVEERVVEDQLTTEVVAVEQVVVGEKAERSVEDEVMRDVVEQVVEGEVTWDVKTEGDDEVREDCNGEGDEKGKEDCKREGGEEVGSLLQGEDEWEGIERTEIEKLFAVAVEYVSSEKGVDQVSKLSHDEQMQLYGLHKVATQGPCYESQPMTLKVSPRAKWHAWQRLGGMNPEAAMEQYISILTDSIPGWMRETPRVNVDQKDDSDPRAVGLPRNEASDSRLSEDSSYTEGGTDHGTTDSKFKQGLTMTILFNLFSPSSVACLTMR